MSLFTAVNLRCPVCGQDNNAQVASSINADRRPDLRAAILADDFQDTLCSNCGNRFRNECDLTYLDVGRRQWIAAFPARAMPDHLDREEGAQVAFDKSYGVGASPVARDIGAGLDVRATFGWPALREKLLLRDLDLDDIAVECMKLDLLRRLPEAPLAAGVELRVIGLLERTLSLAWLRAVTEEGLQTLSLDRALYDTIAADRVGWAAVRAELTRGPFVDMQRLFMGPGRDGRLGSQEPTGAAAPGGR